MELPVSYCAECAGKGLLAIILLTGLYAEYMTMSKKVRLLDVPRRMIFNLTVSGST
jgi:hypothetical protein